MKNKYEVISKFMEFKALIKNHTENNIKNFQSDNGGEFTSNEFKEICKDSGIKRELSTPYNPQQNGVVEWNFKLFEGKNKNQNMTKRIQLKNVKI